MKQTQNGSQVSMQTVNLGPQVTRRVTGINILNKKSTSNDLNMEIGVEMSSLEK